MSAIMYNTAILVFGVLYVAILLVKFVNAALITEAGVSKEEHEKIVQIHNDFRLKLQKGRVANQPRSIDIKRMCWDVQLALEAQKIANTTKFQHVDVYDDRWKHVGQNLALSASTWEKEGADWEWGVKTWHDEVKLYRYGDSPSRKTGHYTQAVWAKTTHVGCGYVNFVTPHERLKYKKLYVCNYGPAGNVNGLPPYKTGRCGCKDLCRSRCKRTKT